MSGRKAEVGMGGIMTVDASVPPETGNVVYVWSINGVSMSTGPSYTTPSDLFVGLYRLDVVAFTADGKRAGSATHTFRVVPETSGLFVIDAETGDESQWDSLVLSGGNTFTADVTAKHNGEYGFKALFGGSGDYSSGRKNLDTPLTEVYVRFYVYFPSSSYPMKNQVGDAQVYGIFHLNDISNGSPFLIAIAAKDDLLEIDYVIHGTNSSTYDNTSIHESISTDEWHSIELYGKIGNGDGECEVWLDGVSILHKENIINDNWDIDYVSVGSEMSSYNTTASEYFYIDDIKADISYID